MSTPEMSEATLNALAKAVKEGTGLPVWAQYKPQPVKPQPKKKGRA